MRTQQQVNVAATYGVLSHNPQTTKNSNNFNQTQFNFGEGQPGGLTKSKDMNYSQDNMGKDKGQHGIAQFISPSSTYARTQSRQGRNTHANTGPNQ